ncbi:hypothetical protein HG536_0F02860 [Torulaspora globosa]|uniref:Uncharacterized protein n=1 Tax=Torulaspora globosa TaxID=48254 RepID=A0A7G3ZKC5_9SACH|nr:uncharacterized protein HG536_0F02860 [Torulaspora globosa]QLL33961.1 hypothetical protein HG536_0F02860 [Torulaspora globosa]
MMREGTQTNITARSDEMTSRITTYIVSPIISVMYLGRGRQASTKPNVITRNDLLRAAQEMPARRQASSHSFPAGGSGSSMGSGDRKLRSRKSHRKEHFESEAA